MAIASDDSDIHKTWLKSYFGGNGDPYIEIVYEDENGNKAREMSKLNLNDHPDDE